MKRYTIDVAVTYIQTVEVDAHLADEAEEMALEVFEVTNATEVRRKAEVAYCAPITEGESK